MRKKDGQQRLIFDTRLLNFMLKTPPKTQLHSAAAFGRLESPVGEDVYCGAADVSNAFYAMEVPAGVGELFALPPVPAKFLHFLQLDGLPLGREDLVQPRLTVLPMGLS